VAILLSCNVEMETENYLQLMSVCCFDFGLRTLEARSLTYIYLNQKTQTCLLLYKKLQGNM
jgi:hypothetical protein